MENRDEQLERAAEIIRAGGLVAFPTETVYGLGANALDPAAVEKIFRLKGRPRGSPLIVHVNSVEMAWGLAREWPPEAERLAARYWPGPLTLVLPKSAVVPDIVTANLPTVAIRAPAHPLALALIRRSGVPVAAPSANRFSTLSPTTAEHVRRSLAGVDFVLDGGASTVGIESTVVSLAGGRPRLLRPGMISRDEIEDVTGPVAEPEAVPEGTHPSPGMHRRHYSPATPLFLLAPEAGLPAGRGAYLRLGRNRPAHSTVSMPAEPRGYAAALYDTLHRLDAQGWDWIAVELPPDSSRWEAVLDRLRRAAG